MASAVSDSKINMVTLKDGTQVPEPDLITTMMNIQAAAKSTLVALFDLVEKCKDDNYKFVANPSGDSKAVLKSYALIDDQERVHDLVKSIVLNATEGSGLSIKIVNPRKI